MENTQQKMRRRLVFFPAPLVGHQNTILGLARVLQSKGFSISVIAMRLNPPNPSNYPQFSFHFIDEGFSESEVSMKDKLAQAKLINKKCVEPFRACLSRILLDANSDNEPVACVIADAWLHFSQAVADDLKVPRIALKTGNISVFTTFFVHPFLREKRHLALRENDLEDLIPELPPLRVKDLSRSPTADQAPLEDMQPNLLKTTNASKGLIFNSCAELEPDSLAIARQECSIPVFPIGPFHKYLPPPTSISPSQDQTIVSWLDSQAPNSVLYVSFGSIATIDQAWFREVAWGLADSKQPFLWVVRSDMVHNSTVYSLDDLLKEFLEEVSGRGRIVHWAPQREVLAHPAVGGFWTHCGWNSTLESICEGVPMICTLSFGDQMLNTRYVSFVWKIGVELDKSAKREDVEKVIKNLMSQKESEDMRKRIACLKNKATHCLNPEGSSFKYMG